MPSTAVLSLLALPTLVATAQAAPPTPPGDARGSFAVYCPESCAELSFDGWTAVRKLPETSSKPVYSVTRYGTDFGIPDEVTLAAWGVGNVAPAASAQEVLVVSWAGPAEGAHKGVVRIGRAMLEVGTVFEDLDTGRFYDADNFRAAVDGYAANAPDVTGLLTFEVGDDGGDRRIVTRGLRKVGLPELVMANVDSETEDAMLTALNAVAQTMFEQGIASQLAVDASQMTSRAVAEVSCGIEGTAELVSARSKNGDPDGPLAAVTFEGTLGSCEPTAADTPQEPVAEADIEATQGMVMLWVDDPATDADTLSLSPLERARSEALSRLSGPVKQAFEAGLESEEELLVKAPFRASDGTTEWLWYRVEGWGATDHLTGRLVSEPRVSQHLSKGDLVVAELKQLFDYLWFKADGSREGNTTQEHL